MEALINDLISRAAAIEAMRECWRRVYQFAKPFEANRIKDCIKAVKDLSAVDAAPVVRCSECKYAHMTYDGECKYCDFWQEEGGDALYLDKGFYCAAGERRDGDAHEHAETAEG